MPTPKREKLPTKEGLFSSSCTPAGRSTNTAQTASGGFSASTSLNSSNTVSILLSAMALIRGPSPFSSMGNLTGSACSSTGGIGTCSSTSISNSQGGGKIRKQYSFTCGGSHSYTQLTYSPARRIPPPAISTS